MTALLLRLVRRADRWAARKYGEQRLIPPTPQDFYRCCDHCRADNWTCSAEHRDPCPECQETR